MPKAAPKKPRPTPEHLYTLDEVQDAANNYTIALIRSNILKDFRGRAGTTLSGFVRGLADALMEDVLLGDAVPPTNTRQLIIPPAEVALALQAASLYILYKYVIPPEEQKETFVLKIFKGE